MLDLTSRDLASAHLVLRPAFYRTVCRLNDVRPFLVQYPYYVSTSVIDCCRSANRFWLLASGFWLSTYGNPCHLTDVLRSRQGLFTKRNLGFFNPACVLPAHVIVSGVIDHLRG